MPNTRGGARGNIRSVSCARSIALTTGWQVCSVPPGSARQPRDLQNASWLDIPPFAHTVAAALRALGSWSLDAQARRFDAEEWWWRISLVDVLGDTATAALGSQETGPSAEISLCLDGLASVAEAWLDETQVLVSDNMFVSHRIFLAREPAPTRPTHLLIRFRALDAVLAQRRGRPRWRVPMVDNQQLRWVRTTLLGRTPGWSPPAAAVGPWRGVRLERTFGIDIEHIDFQSRVVDGAGVAQFSCRARPLDGSTLVKAEMVLTRNGVEHRAAMTPTFAPAPTTSSQVSSMSSSATVSTAGGLTIPGVALWWPHTHGEPALYEAHVEIWLAAGAATVTGESAAPDARVAIGRVGFRTLALDSADGKFALSVNGVPLFCRGACWTPLDPVTLTADARTLATAFDQLVSAGMNMLRVGGTMVYESDEFYDECDLRGVLLWHDFMFANMDYPEDETFTESVRTEAAQFLSRMLGRPSLAILCGSSEGEQQAAMWGATRDRWTPPLFHDVLPAICESWRRDVAYWPSSAHGGDFPHQASSGSTSYYGVGAYLRPLEDARRAEVKFASECLAFANIPDASGLPKTFTDATATATVSAPVRVHHPAWKARTPRDLGAGWDFDDVRDHYLASLYRVDPLALRYADPERYLALGRAVTGEVMAAAFGEWRRRRSSCGGALVWFLRDLWAGAGWGVVDAAGNPKATWWSLRRALQPVALHISDEGVNGLGIHVSNDGPQTLRGDLEVARFRGGEILIGRAQTTVAIAAHDSLEISATALFDGFVDLSYAYRFGPPAQDLVVATLTSLGAMCAQAFHFPLGRPNTVDLDLGLAAEIRGLVDHGAQLHLRTRRFAQSVAIDVEGFAPDDSWFHMAPGSERVVHLSPAAGDPRPLRDGKVQALNCETATRITVGR